MQMEEPDYDILMNINLKAAFMAAKTVVRPMIRNKWGRIINISSVAGVIGQRGSANYAASKAALIGMSKSLAREVGKKNVTVNCIAPGFIETDMTKSLLKPGTASLPRYAISQKPPSSLSCSMSFPTSTTVLAFWSTMPVLPATS
jgi:3-oxoacyl-[acyl-carrier protein] reductase